MSADRPEKQATPKRGRGRPQLPNALTAAQRAKRYRDNKRARQAAAQNDPEISERSQAAVPANIMGNADELFAENIRLSNALAAARVRIHDLIGALELFVNARTKNKRITAEQMKGLHALLALDNPVINEFPVTKRSR